MALPKYYRFVIENKTGVTIAIGEIDLLINRSRTGPTDAGIVYEGSAVALTNAGAISNNTFGVIGAVQDNGTDKWRDGAGHFKSNIAAATPSGDVVLYMQESTDNTNWPDDDRASHIVSVMNITAASTDEQTDFVF
ncbi:MAG: hypothetical protein ACE5IR_26030 [bacterium]